MPGSRLRRGARVRAAGPALAGGAAGGALLWLAEAALESWAQSLGGFSERLLRPGFFENVERALAALVVLAAAALAHLLGARTWPAEGEPAMRRGPGGAGRGEAEGLLRQLSRAVEASSSTVVITDRSGCITYVNPKFTEMTGYTPEEVLGHNPRLLKSGEISPETFSNMWRSIAEGNEWRGEFHNRRKDGSLYWEFASISPVVDASGEITHFVAVKEDITARKLAEQALRESEEKYRLLFSRQFDAAALVDEEAGRFVEVNDAFLRLFGRSREEIDVMAPRELWAGVAAVATAAAGTAVSERWCRRKDGSTFPVEFAAGVFPWRGRTLTCYILRDITDRLHRQRSLEELSTTDGLTGLANWRTFNERLESEWRRAIRSRGSVAVVLADIDFFKAYNDALGHLAGDACLRRVARAMQSVARRTSDLVARWGGEELAVLLPASDLEGATAVAEAMRQAIESLAIAHPSSPVAGVVTASFGVASVVPGEGAAKERLVEAADAALYAAKRDGRNCVRNRAERAPRHLPARGAPAAPPAEA